MKSFIKEGFHIFKGKTGDFTKKNSSPSGRPASGRNGETVRHEPKKK